MSLFTEIALSYCLKYLINRGSGRQCAVEDGELAFQALWDVIPTTPGVNHSSYKLDVNHICEFPWLLQTVETFLFHQLSYNLIGDLNTTKNKQTKKRNGGVKCFKVVNMKSGHQALRCSALAACKLLVLRSCRHEVRHSTGFA